MTTHEFIDEDADLACQDLSDWEKQFFAEIGDKSMRIMEMNQTKKMKKKRKTEEEITFTKALEIVDKLKIFRLRNGIADAHSQVSEIEDRIMNFSTKSQAVFNNIIF